MRLQTKIISTVIVISLIVNILFQYNMIRIEKKTALNNLSSKIQKTSELLSRVNAGPLFYYDAQLIEINIKSFLKDPEIKSIYITETSGEIDLYFENPTAKANDLIEVPTDVYFDGDKIGHITTVYTKSVINNRLNNSIKIALFSIIASSLVILIALLFLIKQIIRPIIGLTELTYEISNGNLNKEIKIYSSDEIGTLSKSFKRMQDSIKEKIESLNKENEERRKAEYALLIRKDELAKANSELIEHRKNLEKLVNQRTSELQESLTNLEKTKDKLVESEKMASLGDLVAGVAHEINTPVGIGVTAASHLESETKQFHKTYQSGEMSKSSFEAFINLVTESSTMILSNMVRAASLIQSFKKVAVDQSSEEKRQFKIKSYIDEVLLSIHSKFKHTNHKVNIICEEDITLDSYPGALSQIITNLCINSLIHGFENIDEGIIDIKIEDSSEYAKIIYHDNGVGIAPDLVKRIFDPFFTTKRGQGGSGLGMNIVYNLVNQTLKGNIECESELGNGTTFNIKIPKNV